MKIAFISTHSNGRSEAVEEFISRWPMYKKSDYRKALAGKKLNTNQKGDKKSQKIILDAMIDEAQAVSVGDDKFVIADGCVVENMAYTLWLNSKELGKVDDEFVMDSRVMVNQTVKQFDLIFYIPLREEIKLSRKSTENNLEFRREIDNLLDAMVATYEKNKGVFFPLDDCPAVIRLEGPPDLRVEQILLYVKANGLPYGVEDGSLI